MHISYIYAYLFLFLVAVSNMADSSAAAYIRMVHHLIEKCLQFHMNMEECIEALSKHANITPTVTSTVWKELEKENKEFFESYKQARENAVLVQSLQNKQVNSDNSDDAIEL